MVQWSEGQVEGELGRPQSVAGLCGLPSFWEGQRFPLAPAVSLLGFVLPGLPDA